MPNWVNTRIEFEANTQKEIDEIVNFVKSENSDFDFNKIIPMPEELNIEESSVGNSGMYYLELKKRNFENLDDNEKDFLNEFNKKAEERRNKCIELGQKYLDNIAKYGYKTWYNWCYENWDTKWNASEVENYSNSIFFFSTAWSFPVKVIKALSDKFPNVTINYLYADEQGGYYSGGGYFFNGEDFGREYENESDEAYEAYNELWTEAYVKENGKWKFIYANE